MPSCILTKASLNQDSAPETPDVKPLSINTSSFSDPAPVLPTSVAPHEEWVQEIGDLANSHGQFISAALRQLIRHNMHGTSPELTKALLRDGLEALNEDGPKLYLWVELAAKIWTDPTRATDVRNLAKQVTGNVGHALRAEEALTAWLNKDINLVPKLGPLFHLLEFSDTNPSKVNANRLFLKCLDTFRKLAKVPDRWEQLMDLCPDFEIPEEQELSRMKDQVTSSI